MTKKIVHRCPHCHSDHIDLWLGGKVAMWLYKCLDCGYVGHEINFTVPVVEKVEPKKTRKESLEQK